MDAVHCNENLIYVLYSFSGNCAASVPMSTFMCLWAINISPGSVYIFGCIKMDDRSWKYINLSQIYECRNWETEHYYSVLEIRRLHSYICGYINGNQTFILDSHWPFICSVYECQISISSFGGVWRIKILWS